jgi:pseudolysin
MNFKPVLKPVAACFAVLAASSLYAAQPVNLRILPPNTLISSGFDLKQISQITDSRQVTHTRMQQQYKGFDVVGGDAIIHKAKSASFQSRVRMNGIVYQGLAQDLGMPAQDLEEKGSLALNAFLVQYQGAAINNAKVKPVVYIDKNNQAHWAYHLSASVKSANSIPQKPNALIDAKTHQVG